MAKRNVEVIELLRELTELTILDEGDPQSFRARAYEMAALELEGVRDDISQMSERQLVALDGVGKSTAKKIREYVDTGHIAKLDALREAYPPSFRELARIPGLGPKTLAAMRSKLGVESVEDLRAAIESQRVRELPRMGPKSEDKIRRALDRIGTPGKSRRTPIARALPIAERLVEAVEAIPAVDRALVCGSLRRLRESVADIDIIAASSDPAPVMAAFVDLPEVREVLARGDTKTSILADDGLQVDLRVVGAEQYGAAILYFTGSKAHNIKLRQLALKRGWTLNEYGLTEVDSGHVVASATEASIYAALGLPTIPEPMREDTGEVERAAAGELPEPVRAEDLVGDLHVHTSRSGDGRAPLADVVRAAARRGYAYLAITDHGENLAINGVSREGLREQRRELDELQRDYPDLTLLHGCELNIGPEGDLDYDAGFRRELDLCVAAVHSHFDLPADAQTRRVIAAIEDPTVHVIGHLTGRRIGERPGIELDVGAVLTAAARTGTAIEINASLARLDAPAEILRQARDLGVTFAVSTDAHDAAGLDRLRLGALQAQRGWVERGQVVNTWPRKALLAWLAGPGGSA